MMTQEQNEKIIELLNLEGEYQEKFRFDNYFYSFYNVGEETLIDKKIEYLTRAIKENKELISYEDSENLFELMPNNEFLF